MLSAQHELDYGSLLYVNYPILAYAVLLVQRALPDGVVFYRARRKNLHQEGRNPLDPFSFRYALGLLRVEEKNVRLNNVAGRQHYVERRDEYLAEFVLT